MKGEQGIWERVSEWARSVVVVVTPRRPARDSAGLRVSASRNRDANYDGALNILDFMAFQNQFALGDVAADINRDGKLDVADFTAFQNEFALGCW